MRDTQNDPGERDAVCFTAGYAGVFFAAGTVHAHLAADRPAPAVVAGISAGALNAAAMQRCYLELEKQKRETPCSPASRESARWAWLRKYVAMLVENPANVLWDSIPNPNDFFADASAPPVRDLSLPCCLREEEKKANHQRYLLTWLGIWGALSELRGKWLAILIVRYVRFKEKYTRAPIVGFLLSVMSVALQTIWHIIWWPKMVSDRTEGLRTRPLLGWRVYLAAWVLPLAVIASAVLFPFGHWIAGTVTLGLAALVPAVAFGIVRRQTLAVLKKFLLPSLLTSLGFEKSLLHNFHLRWRLEKLFDQQKVNAGDMKTLIVAAPLQTVYQPGGRTPAPAQQLWANPNSEITVLDALTAALALPGIWPPVTVEGSKLDEWAPLKKNGKHPAKNVVDLVDGSVVRQNALPALLEFLRGRPDVAKLLQRPVAEGQKCPKASIYVIYSVPHGGLQGNGHLPEDQANIVDVAQVSRKLARGRDTGLEVEQVKVVTRLGLEIRAAGAVNSDLVVAMADEIAPDPLRQDAGPSPFVPGREMYLKQVADGCRRTLEKLYATQIRNLPVSGSTVPCGELLRSVAINRPWNGGSRSISEGLPEVCECCSQDLQRSGPADCGDPPAPRTGPRSLISEKLPPEDRFPNLKVRRMTKGCDGKERPVAQPRIVVVWSGGVFRGAFHIGMIGALLKCHIQPDLIASASVGTLMGGVLASMFSEPNGDALARLKLLVDTFRHVDAKVALTKPLKEAARDLGIRGGRVTVSAALIRSTVLSGTQADAGYAATGAPPALIDAIASFLSIPVDQTKEMASDFVSGQVAQATQKMLVKIKEHTLARLNIQTSIIGSSLLEQRAKELIGGKHVDTNHPQPFRKRRIAFFATTTDLGAQKAQVLWDAYAQYDQPYDFIQAALASSAFPAVFPPRRQSDVFPGWGRTDIRYSDGGMFDNLPFIPAITALSQVQLEESETFAHDPREMANYVRERYANPDLFLTGALNALPEEAGDRDGPFPYFHDIASRAWSLGDNSKIHSFVGASGLVHRQLGILAAAAPATLQAHHPEFVRSVVNAGVLSVFPTDKDHLNKTFAFCKTTGLQSDKVLGSVADGCFQTFKTLKEAAVSGSDCVKKSIESLTKLGRMPVLATITKKELSDSKGRNACRFFTKNEEVFACPFAEAGALEVYHLCINDASHGER